MKATMSMSPPRDPIAALNQTLSEVIDEVLEVKQARWIVPETHALHGQLDQLFDDLGTWARLLVEQDDALGVSPLASMPSVAGRERPNLGRGAATDEEIRRIVGEHLDRLEQHVAAALAEQEDDRLRTALGEVVRGLLAQREVFRER
jgi:DNA-binding ferritin-like protein